MHLGGDRPHITERGCLAYSLLNRLQEACEPPGNTYMIFMNMDFFFLGGGDMAQMVQLSQKNLLQAMHRESMDILFLTFRKRKEFGPWVRLPFWKGMILC